VHDGKIVEALRIIAEYCGVLRCIVETLWKACGSLQTIAVQVAHPPMECVTC